MLLLRPQAFAAFDPSARAALWSFALCLVIWPCNLFDSYMMDSQYIKKYDINLGDYLWARSVQIWLSAVVPFAPVWVLCRWQGLSARFPLLVTTQNWQILFFSFVSTLLNLATQNVWFTYSQIIAMGIIAFLVQLLYAWYTCWRALGCNPFYAAGIAAMLFMVATTFGDILNIRLFGVARPFVELGILH